MLTHFSKGGKARMGNLVMVIDDSLTVRKIMETSLKREGFEAITFPDGLAAMQALARGEVPVPDLILLDVGLPKMDGYDVARAFKQKNRLGNTVIIMLSGRDGMIDKFRGRLAGAKGYITKPFKPTEVIDVVRTHLPEERSVAFAQRYSY
jgi:twitching motility two-component system response regulator PilG